MSDGYNDIPRKIWIGYPTLEEFIAHCPEGATIYCCRILKRHREFSDGSGELKAATVCCQRLDARDRIHYWQMTTAIINYRHGNLLGNQQIKITGWDTLYSQVERLLYPLKVVHAHVAVAKGLELLDGTCDRLRWNAATGQYSLKPKEIRV